MNGPGIRWLAPKLARNYLSHSGFQGSFNLEGSLTGGLSVKDLKLEGNGAVAELHVGSITPHYRLGELRKGKLKGIDVDGLHATLRLGMETQVPEKKSPLDLEKTLRSMRALRDILVPMNVNVTDITLDVSDQEKPLVSLAKTEIHHSAGKAEFAINLGSLTDATGRKWPARDSTLVWNKNQLTIDHLDLLPGIGFKNFEVELPENGGPSLETELLVDDAAFVVTASRGITSVQVNLREGGLEISKLAKRFHLDLPASGELKSFSADIDHLLPNPKAATGSLRILLDDLQYQGWTIPELSLDATLEDGSGTLAAKGRALNSEFSLTTEADIGREDGGFHLGEVAGNFSVAEVSKIVPALGGKLTAIHPEAEVPEATVTGGFLVTFADNKPQSAEVKMSLKPAKPETTAALDLTFGWKSDQTASLQLATKGVTGNANFDIAEAAYDARMEFDDFTSVGIAPWLGIAKVSTAGTVSLTGTWHGSGDIDTQTHQGKVDLASAELARDGMPPIQLQGQVTYDWPRGFTTHDLLVKANDQTLTAELKLGDGFLDLNDLRWQDGGTEMASGNARLPVPQDFSKWRDTLANDERPVSVSIESKELPLASLKDWLPAAEKLDPASTGKLDMQVSGTYGKPEIAADLSLKGLHSPQQPKIPPTDVQLNLTAGDGRVSIQGTATAPDIPPANLSASMPFRPAEWAKDPPLIKTEAISGRVDLPRLDISRFGSLVPGAKKLSGTVSGNIEIGGELGQPLAKGKLDLAGGNLEMENSAIPQIKDLSATMDLASDRIELKNLKTTLAGGTLTGGGSIALEHGKPGQMEFRLKGDHLPLRRDDSLILRANTDLRLTGSIEQAALSGTVSVVDSLFFRDIELLPIGSPFTVPSAAALPKIDTANKPTDVVPERFRNWTLDVTLRTEEPFLIRGNLAAGSITGSIRVGGTLGNPAPVGKLDISNFKASLPFSTLSVASGSAVFTPESGFDPQLEIRGTAEPRPYQVNVYVYGRASDPQLVLTSSPPLPENEIMTLLATGTTTSGLEDPQATSSRALQLLAEELRRGRFGFGKRLRPLLSLLDRVDFTLAEEDPYSSQSFSTATVKLTDRWFLTAGMGDEGNSRILAIWRLRFY